MTTFTRLVTCVCVLLAVAPRTAAGAVPSKPSLVRLFVTGQDAIRLEVSRGIDGAAVKTFNYTWHELGHTQNSPAVTWISNAGVTCNSDHFNSFFTCANALDISSTDTWRNRPNDGARNYITFDFKRPVSLSKFRWSASCHNFGKLSAIRTFQIETLDDDREDASWERVRGVEVPQDGLENCEKNVVRFDSRVARFWKLKVYNSFQSVGIVTVKTIEFFGKEDVEVHRGSVVPSPGGTTSMATIATSNARELPHQISVKACNEHGCGSAYIASTGIPTAPTDIVLKSRLRMPDYKTDIYNDHVKFDSFVNTTSWKYRDSWDPPEKLEIYVNNDLQWAWQLPAFGGDTQECGGSWTDKYVGKATFEVAVASSEMEIKFTSTINQGSADESLAIDNLRVQQLSVFPVGGADRNLSSSFNFDDDHCYATERYICSPNKINVGARSTTAILGMALADNDALVTVKNAKLRSYEVALSQCNEFGCSPPRIARTSVPSMPSFFSLTQSPSLFFANISWAEADENGSPVIGYKVIVSSYNADGNLVSVSSYPNMTGSTRNDVLRISPIAGLGTSAATQIQVYLCNGIGCSTKFSYGWNIGVEAQSTLSHMLLNPRTAEIAFKLSSVVEDGKGAPTKTIVTWQILTNISASVDDALAPSVPETGQVAYPFASERNVSLTLSFAGALVYQIKVRHCVTVGSAELCSSDINVGESLVESSPLVPNHNGRPVKTRTSSKGGSIQLVFNQTGFWGYNSNLGKRRKTLIRIYEDGKLIAPASAHIFHVAPSVHTGVETIGVVRGLKASKSYTFQIAAKNGDHVSAWTAISFPGISPGMSPPDPPLVSISDEVNDIRSTYVFLTVKPTFLNGAEATNVSIYTYPLEKCGVDSANWNTQLDNITVSLGNVNSYKLEAVNYYAHEDRKVFRINFEGLQNGGKYLFRATVYNAMGSSEMSPCCTDDDIVTTKVEPKIVYIAMTGGGSRRRLIQHNHTAENGDVINANGLASRAIQMSPFENTIFTMQTGYYHDYELTFPRKHMALISQVGVTRDDVTFNCGGHRCFDFSSGYVPGEIKGITFTNSSAPSGGNGGIMFLGPFAIFSSPLKITNCAFLGGSAKRGGAIFIFRPGVHIFFDDILFRDNVATDGGGAICFNSVKANLTNIHFSKNAAQYGGALAVSSTMEASVVHLANFTSIKDQASSDGGAFYFESSKVSMINGSGVNHVAKGSGSYMYAKTSSIEIDRAHVMGSVAAEDGTVGCYGTQFGASNVVMKNNVARDGGCIFGVLCAAYIQNCDFVENIASRHGGAVALTLQSEMTADNSTFSRNNAAKNKGDGGALYYHHAKYSFVRNSKFVQNLAGRGGAVRIVNSPFESSGNQFSKYQASAGGGGAILWTVQETPPVTSGSNKNGETIVPNTFDENEALYGANMASDPKQIVVMDEQMKPLSFLEARNDATFKAWVHLVDFYGQKYSDQAYEYPRFKIDVASYNTNDDPPSRYRLRGNIGKTLPNLALTATGNADPNVAVFDDLELAEMPGAYVLTFSSEKGVKDAIVNINITLCDKGEILKVVQSGVVCEVCKAGQYDHSFDFMPVAPGQNYEEQCQSCSVGQYQSEDKQVSCEDCPIGLEAGLPGATECIDKKPGDVTLTAITFKSDYNHIEFAWEKGNNWGQDALPITGFEYQLSDTSDFIKATTLSVPSNQFSIVKNTTKPLWEAVLYFRVRTVLRQARGDWSAASDKWAIASDCSDASVYLLALDHSVATWHCAKCPVGTDCTGARTHQQLYTLPGYSRVNWAPSYLSPPIECPNKDACVGGHIIADPTTLCRNGTTGTLCMICAPGYGYQFGKCEECSIKNLSAQLSVVVALALVGFFLIWYARKKLRKYKSVWRDILRALKINVDFLQIISAIPELVSITWPPIFYQFLAYFDFVNADFLSLTGASCVEGLDFNLKYFGMSLLPIFGLSLGTYSYFHGLREFKESEAKREKQTEHSQRMDWLENHEYVKETFRSIDVDRNGHIDIRELQTLLKSFGYKITVKKVEEIVHTLFGKDKDKISQVGFCAAYESGELQKCLQEKIGFLYTRFNGGAEAWEVHEIVKKAILTGAIVFIQDPVIQAATAVVVCAFSIANLNYFRPHKNKLLFWIAQISFMTTLLVFLFAIVLMAVDGANAGQTLFVIGIILIVLNINVVCVSIVAMFAQVRGVMLKVRKEEKLSKVQVAPGTKKSLKNYTRLIIDSKTPVAARHMTEFARSTFGASSDQYKRIIAICKDLQDDRIHHKRDLLRRVEDVFSRQAADVKLHAYSLANELWLVD
eukprot:Stramenopile-MAST_4_protein_627